MSEEEINNIFSGVGFVSQWQLMQEADQEQELIVDNYEKDLSQPWPAHQIKEFKQKYDDVFMFEPYDSTDFIAHYKLKGSTYSSFVNRRGVFLIGDSVAHAPVYLQRLRRFSACNAGSGFLAAAVRLSRHGLF